MTDNTENLVLEMLRQIRGDLGEIRQDIRDMKDRMTNIELRMTAMEHHMAAIVLTLPMSNDRFDKIEARLARVERRLELSD